MDGWMDGGREGGIDRLGFHNTSFLYRCLDIATCSMHIAYITKLSLLKYQWGIKEKSLQSAWKRLDWKEIPWCWCFPMQLPFCLLCSSSSSCNLLPLDEVNCFAAWISHPLSTSQYLWISQLFLLYRISQFFSISPSPTTGVRTDACLQVNGWIHSIGNWRCFLAGQICLKVPLVQKLHNCEMQKLDVSWKT